MRRMVLGGVAVVAAVCGGACAQAIRTVETTPGKDTFAVHTMRLEFHDAVFGGCKLREKPARITASKGKGNPNNRDVVIWELQNQCEEPVDVCLVGFLPEKKFNPLMPDPLEDVDDQNKPQAKRRCDSVLAGQSGRIRTRVLADAAEDEYEYNIRLRKGQRWKTVDPMIDIVP